MTGPIRALATLAQRQPDWAPWLRVVDVALRETRNPVWDVAGPKAVNCPDALLTGEAIVVPLEPLGDLFARLVAVAGACSPAMATLERVVVREQDLLALFAASINDDEEYVRAVATRFEASPDALRSVTTLFYLPALQAIGQRWSASIPQTWPHGYCPVCAAWPAFAEIRGIERQQYARCARCGVEWRDELLRCRYCRNINHQELVMLAPQRRRMHASVEACVRCGQYTKAFTTLQGCPPGDVLVIDLESVDLDLAALDEGYTRPQGLARPLGVEAIAARQHAPPEGV